MTRSVLVTDGEERASLAVVRSLGRAGYRVGSSSRRGHRSLAGSSRYAADCWTAPDPLADQDAYCRRLREIVVGDSFDLLLPMTEASLLAVLPRRSWFEGVMIPFPLFEKFEAITDKSRVMDVARSIGIDVPTQVTIEHSDDRHRMPPADLGFPLVLKPSRSVGQAEGVRAKVGVVHVADPERFRQAIDQLPAHAFPLLVQEKIEGRGEGVFLLMQEGELMARFAHRRIREKPPSGGVSVCRESIPVDQDLAESSRALLDRFGWEGIAMVEYKIADGSGRAYIMEINPRFWGSLQLAIDAGVDFPRLLVESAFGRRVPPVTSYRIGVRTRWWWGEVDHSIARVKSASGYGGRARQILSGARQLVTGWGGNTRAEVWSREDPRPFMTETLDWLHGE